MTVRETLDFSARVQGVGFKAGARLPFYMQVQVILDLHALIPACMDRQVLLRAAHACCGSLCP